MDSVSDNKPDSTPLTAPQTYWDKINEARWGRYLSALEERVVQQALDFASQPGMSVDIGCGSGRWSAMAAKAGWHTVCLDVDPKTLSVCEQNVPNADCYLLDPEWTTLPLPPGSARAAFCIEVFTVMGRQRFDREVDRVLAPGGLFVGVFGNLRSWRGLVAQLSLKASKQRNYYPKSYSAWRRGMEVRGFEYLYEEGYGWAPFSRASDSPLIPFSAQLEQHLGLRRCTTISPWVIFIARKCQVLS